MNLFMFIGDFNLTLPPLPSTMADSFKIALLVACVLIVICNLIGLFAILANARVSFTVAIAPVDHQPAEIVRNLYSMYPQMDAIRKMLTPNVDDVFPENVTDENVTEVNVTDVIVTGVNIAEKYY